MKAIQDLLNKLGIRKKKKPRDWSKSDRENIDNFRALQQAGRRDLQIQPLNRSNYNDRRFSGRVSPDYVGPGEFSAGTKDKMPGTTPTLTIKPTHKKKKHSKGGTRRKTSDYI